MRVAIEGCDDSLDLKRIDGVWVTEDCDPVEVDFAWDRGASAETVVTEVDCICPAELATRLVDMFLHPRRDDVPTETELPGRRVAVAAMRQMA